MLVRGLVVCMKQCVPEPKLSDEQREALRTAGMIIEPIPHQISVYGKATKRYLIPNQPQPRE